MPTSLPGLPEGHRVPSVALSSGHRRLQLHMVTVWVAVCTHTAVGRVQLSACVCLRRLRAVVEVPGLSQGAGDGGAVVVEYQE